LEAIENKSRPRGEHIDFSRFIKRNQYVEEKPYVSKHSFADFYFHAQLYKNIWREPGLSIQDRYKTKLYQQFFWEGCFGLANTWHGQDRGISFALNRKNIKN